MPRPMLAVNARAAALFRSVSDPAGRPTILFDEIDTVFGPKAGDNEELRGFLNAGHRRSGVTYRCIGDGGNQTVVEFPSYTAVAVAGLGYLPDTITTRSVIIRMRRRARNEHVEPFRARAARGGGQQAARPARPVGRPGPRGRRRTLARDARGRHRPPRRCMGAADRRGRCGRRAVARAGARRVRGAGQRLPRRRQGQSRDPAADRPEGPRDGGHRPDAHRRRPGSAVRARRGAVGGHERPAARLPDARQDAGRVHDQRQHPDQSPQHQDRRDRPQGVLRARSPRRVAAVLPPTPLQGRLSK